MMIDNESVTQQELTLYTNKKWSRNSVLENERSTSRTCVIPIVLDYKRARQSRRQVVIQSALCEVACHISSIAACNDRIYVYNFCRINRSRCKAFLVVTFHYGCYVVSKMDFRWTKANPIFCISIKDQICLVSDCNWAFHFTHILLHTKEDWMWNWQDYWPSFSHHISGGRNFFMAGLFTLRVFARNLLREGSRRRNIFHISFLITDLRYEPRLLRLISRHTTY